MHVTVYSNYTMCSNFVHKLFKFKPCSNSIQAVQVLFNVGVKHNVKVAFTIFSNFTLCLGNSSSVQNLFICKLYSNIVHLLFKLNHWPLREGDAAAAEQIYRP